MRAFDVNPIYLQHDKQGQVPDYRVSYPLLAHRPSISQDLIQIDTIFLNLIIIKIPVCCLFVNRIVVVVVAAAQSALANPARPSLPIPQNVVRLSDVWPQGAAIPHSKGNDQSICDV